MTCMYIFFFTAKTRDQYCNLMQFISTKVSFLLSYGKISAQNKDSAPGLGKVNFDSVEAFNVYRKLKSRFCNVLRINGLDCPVCTCKL